MVTTPHRAGGVVRKASFKRPVGGGAYDDAAPHDLPHGPGIAEYRSAPLPQQTHAAHHPNAHSGAKEEPVRVVVRLRPPELRPDLQKAEEQKDASQRTETKIAGISADGRTLFDGTHVKWRWDQRSVTNVRGADSGSAFQFARVYAPGDPTTQLYNEQAKGVVKRVLDGFNGCIFAYGQTNSGKTYTISGDQMRPGIVPHACLDIFKHMKDRGDCVSLLRMSYMEIYNEQVKDLLADSTAQGGALQFGEEDGRGVVVKNRTEKVVSTLEEVLDWLRLGEQRRAVGRNNVHEHASRSHAVFQLIFETRDASHASRAVRVSTLSVVDLAGSESNYNNFEQTPTDYLSRVKDTQTIAAKLAHNDASDVAIAKKDREGSNIRRSLTALVRVVQTLASKPDAHIPYRDSKLTRLLSGALGGSSSTLIVCTVNPVEEKETVSTLRFAITAQRVHNRPKTVTLENDKAMLGRYEESLRDLQRNMMMQEQQSAMQLEAYRAQTEAELSRRDKEMKKREAEAEELQKRMTSLSRYILTSNKLAVADTPSLKTHYGRNPTGRASTRQAGASGNAASSDARGRTSAVEMRSGPRRRHSFDDHMRRSAKSRELFDDVGGADVTRATRIDDAIGILRLANAEAMKTTHTDIVKQQVAGFKGKIEALEAKVKRQEGILSKSGKEKERALAMLQEKVQEYERQILDMKDGHEAELAAAERRAASERMALEAKKEIEMSEVRRAAQAAAAEQAAQMQTLKDELAAARADCERQAGLAGSLHTLGMQLAAERSAMLKALGDQPKGGCMAPPPLPIDRWKKHVPGRAEVLAHNPVLRDYDVSTLGRRM